MKTAFLEDDLPCVGQSGTGRSGRQGAVLCSGYTHPVTRQWVGVREEWAKKKGHTKEARWRGTLAASFLETQTLPSKNCQET